MQKSSRSSSLAWMIALQLGALLLCSNPLVVQGIIRPPTRAAQHFLIGKARSVVSERRSLVNPALVSAIELRGGGGGDDDDDDSDRSSIFQISKRAVTLAGKITFRILKTSARVVGAIFDRDDDSVEESGEESGVVSKILRTFGRMWRAAFSSDGDDEADVEEEEGSEESDVMSDEEDSDVADESSTRPDFGNFLSRSYDIEATREGVDDATPILGGSINDALRAARSQCRLLLVYIPSSRPGKGKKSGDNDALTAFLSKEVALLAEKRARKKELSGSYLLWSARAGSPEAVVAIKRLKAQQTNNKGQKRPILLVAYPAQVMDNRGQPQVSPKLLAQHHCSPPPPTDTMVTWLNALRKRHAKEYASMHLQAKETQYFKDRKAGYKDSLKSDKQREEREAREKAERIAKEKAEKERQAKLAKRREELLESLPDEPESGEADIKTLSLRLADGRTGRRRFSDDDELSDVFNWADGTFEIERESMQLTTMNGKSSFTWEDRDKTLSESGLGKMAGLRVSQKKDTKSEEGDAS